VKEIKMNNKETFHIGQRVYHICFCRYNHSDRLGFIGRVTQIYKTTIEVLYDDASKHFSPIENIIAAP
jgi:hypothetical protein